MPSEDSSTTSPQEPATAAPQPVTESPEPVIENPAPVAEPATPPQEVPPALVTPEVPPALVEVIPTPETAPDSAQAMPGTQPTTTTAQIPPNEPMAPESDPFDSPQPSSEQAAQDKPTPTHESPSAVAPAQTGILRTARDLLVKARVALQDRKRKKRDKIMQALNSKSKITNDDVEKLLHVSDATATRYLSVLVKEGKIKQDRRTGAGVSYSRAP